jgi:hypothetical protein
MLVTFGRDLFRLNAPLVNSIKINHDGGHFYETLGGSGMRRYTAAPPRVEVEIVADMGMTCRDCGIPDLTAFAERLTVEQLFQVIQRKLKARDDERSR